MLLGRPYDLSADVFSFGVILCEVITGRAPDSDHLAREAATGFALDETELLYAILPDCPEGLEALCYQCCETSPQKRPSAAQCLEEIDLILSELNLELPPPPTSRARKSDPSPSNEPTSSNPQNQPIHLKPEPQSINPFEMFFTQPAPSPPPPRQLLTVSQPPSSRDSVAITTPLTNPTTDAQRSENSHSADKDLVVAHRQALSARRKSVRMDYPAESVGSAVAAASPVDTQQQQQVAACSAVLDRLQSIEHSMHDNVAALQQLHQPPPPAEPVANKDHSAQGDKQAESALLTQYVSAVGDIHSKIGSMQHQIDEIRSSIQSLLLLQSGPAISRTVTAVPPSVLSEPENKPTTANAPLPIESAVPSEAHSLGSVAVEAPHATSLPVSTSARPPPSQESKLLTSPAADVAGTTEISSPTRLMADIERLNAQYNSNLESLRSQHGLETLVSSAGMSDREVNEAPLAQDCLAAREQKGTLGGRLLQEPLLASRHRSPTMKKALGLLSPAPANLNPAATSIARDSLYARSHLHAGPGAESPGIASSLLLSASSSAARNSDLRSKIERFAKHVASVSSESDHELHSIIDLKVEIPSAEKQPTRSPRGNGAQKQRSSSQQLSDSLGSFLRVAERYDESSSERQSQRASAPQDVRESRSSRREGSPARGGAVVPALNHIPLRSSSRGRSSRSVQSAESSGDESSGRKHRRRRGEPLSLAELYEGRPRMHFAHSAPVSPYDPRVMYTQPTDFEKGFVPAPRSPTYLPRGRSVSPSNSTRSLGGSGQHRSTSPFHTPGRNRHALERGVVTKEALSTRKNPTVYSFPSDAKPRLGFEMHDGTVYRRVY